MATQGITSFIGGFFGKISFTTIILIIFIAIIAISIIGLIVYFIWNKIQWNLKVEFKLTRSNGQFTDAQWGKGSFNKKRGVVWLKRPKQKKVSMKPFDVKEYLQGTNILTVEQTGIDTYIPVHPKSFETVLDEQIDKLGNKQDVEVALMSLKADTTESKSWKNSHEREAIGAFSITSFLKEHGALIAMGFVIFLQFVGFSILYGKIK